MTSSWLVVARDVFFIDPTSSSSSWSVVRGTVAVGHDGTVSYSPVDEGTAQLVLNSNGRHIVIPGLRNAFADPVNLVRFPPIFSWGMYHLFFPLQPVHDPLGDVSGSAVLTALSRGLTSVTLSARLAGSQTAQMLTRMGVQVDIHGDATTPSNVTVPSRSAFSSSSSTAAAAAKQDTATAAALVAAPASLSPIDQVVALMMANARSKATAAEDAVRAAADPAAVLILNVPEHATGTFVVLVHSSV